ncbi:TrkA C-terminal domain-containing protein [Streptomyces sp. McG8]|uniref:TrkA C-terminal domain-containing protein n=1 Tax=Streptomyces sp. McG8 TaxID=2725487 RepID=UPI001BE510C7|nr:potassium transporter TrkA [Streptomyces sp. McG8]
MGRLVRTPALGLGRLRALVPPARRGAGCRTPAGPVDPDDTAVCLKLNAEEAASVVDALLPSHHSPNLLATAELGLVAERIELPATSYWNGRVLGDTRMRTETGVSVVAVLRRAEAIPSPGPDFRLAGGDTLIVIGTREGVGVAADILSRE